MISALSPFCRNHGSDDVDDFADRYYKALVVALIETISREPTAVCQRTEIPEGSQIHIITNFIADSHTHRDNPCFDIWQLKCVLSVIENEKSKKYHILRGMLGLGASRCVNKLYFRHKTCVICCQADIELSRLVGK